jgi:hypothetical protein
MTKWGLLGLVLFLAACEGAPTPPPVAEAPRPAGLARGIDMPRDARDVALELTGSHLDFVARYYRDPASRWPALSPEEARSVSLAGISLVTVWESHSHRPDYFNYAAGYNDALMAYRQAWMVGQPAGSAIYFAVDFNAQPADIMGEVDRYFRGIAAGFAAARGPGPGYRIGVYGSGAVCDYLKRMRLAQYAWLSNSTAWSGYDSFADWDIRQSGRSQMLSFDQDQNEARGEYGGFRVANQYSSL